MPPKAVTWLLAPEGRNLQKNSNMMLKLDVPIEEYNFVRTSVL